MGRKLGRRKKKAFKIKKAGSSEVKCCHLLNKRGLNMRHYYIIKTIDNNQASEKIEKN
jgi:hypothetical protein